jgi:hypothetical protein
MFPLLPNEDEQLKHLLFIHDWMTSQGFEHYEISNFAKPGKKARHNLNYWNFGDYLGIGAGAHSKLSFPHRKTGLRVSGKTREEWTKRLSKVLSGNVDLSYVKDFYPNHTLNFEFLHNDRGYRIYQSGESSSSASYVLQLYKPSATGRIKGAIAGLI